MVMAGVVPSGGDDKGNATRNADHDGADSEQRREYDRAGLTTPSE